jgi:hypothetical protein
MKNVIRLLPALGLFAALPLCADDATDNIDAAKAAYEAGNYSEALTALDTANQFIRQKKAEEVVKLLPAAPKGWEAGEPETEAAATSILGGGVSARRTYTRGESNVSIKIQSDSTVMQYAAMLSNPMLLAASGAKMETIKGQRVTVEFKSGDNNGTIKAVVDGRYLVEIEGNSVTLDDLRTFAKAFDYAKLTAMK